MSRYLPADIVLSTAQRLLLAVRSNGTGARLRAVGALVIVGLLVWAALASPALAILGAFTAVVAVGLFVTPKLALSVIALFLVLQPAFVNVAGTSETPLGLALHRLHEAFAVAAVFRIAFFLGWERVNQRVRRWFWLTVLFLAAGLGSAVVAQVPLQTMALGAFLAVKFQVFLLLVLTIPWSERDCERIMRVALWLGPLVLASGVLVRLAPPEVQNLFIDTTLEGGGTVLRAGLNAMQGIFPHPGVFGWASAVTGCYALAALLTGRTAWRVGGTVSLGASMLGILGSLRRKPLGALPVAALYGAMRSAKGRRRWAALVVFAALAGGAGVLLANRLAAAYRDVLVYVDPGGATMPRVLLYVAGAEIANARFPLGAGFGRFGGYASTLDYSPLYDEYGLSGIYGLTSDNPMYAMDTYWPHIAAETGWVGAAILAVFFLLLVERSTRVGLAAADPATKALAVGAALALVEGLVESAAGPVFEVSLFAFAIAVPLGVSIARLDQPAAGATSLSLARSAAAPVVAAAAPASGDSPSPPSPEGEPGPRPAAPR